MEPWTLPLTNRLEDEEPDGNVLRPELVRDEVDVLPVLVVVRDCVEVLLMAFAAGELDCAPDD